MTSPAVADSTVYVGSGDGSVYAIDAEDGIEQWAVQTDGPVYSSPVVVEGTVYVGTPTSHRTMPVRHLRSQVVSNLNIYVF